MFKTQVNEDIERIFLNFNEFADENNIDGVGIMSILHDTDCDGFKEFEPHEVDGVLIEVETLFLKKDDLDYLPVAKQQMRVNNQQFYVHSVTESMGLLEIKLREYTA